MERHMRQNTKQSNVQLSDVLKEQDLVKAELCRQSFYYFVQEFWGEIIQAAPVFNFHVQFICNELEEIAKRQFMFKDSTWTMPKEGGRAKSLYNLLVNVPPGTTKSTIISQMFPAWCWVNDPRS